MIRVSSREVRSAASQCLWVEPGELAGRKVDHPALANYWERVRPDAFTMGAGVF